MVSVSNYFPDDYSWFIWTAREFLSEKVIVANHNQVLYNVHTSRIQEEVRGVEGVAKYFNIFPVVR